MTLIDRSAGDELTNGGALAVDVAAARVGGGVSRVNELTSAFSALAPTTHYVLAISPTVRAALKVVPPHASYIEVPRALNSGLARMAWEHSRLPSLLNRCSPDWILSPFNILPLGPRLGPSRTAVIVSSIAPFHPRLIEQLSNPQKARVRLLRELTLRSIDRADHVFLLSQEARRLLGGRLSDKPVTHLPMSPPPQATIEAARRAELPPEATQGRYFLVPGEVWRYRAAHEAIEALRRLERAAGDADLLVCGGQLDTDYVNELRVLAARSKGLRVRFLGGCSHVELLALMRESVATIFCSRVENVSRMPVEAMAMDSPVIAVNLPSSWESCGSAAHYYEPGNVDELSAVMSRLLDSDAARQAAIGAGREHLSDRDALTATRILLTTIGMLDAKTPVDGLRTSRR